MIRCNCKPCYSWFVWLISRPVLGAAVMMGLAVPLGYAAGEDSHGHSHDHHAYGDESEADVLDILDHHKLHLLEEGALVYAEVSADSISDHHDEHSQEPEDEALPSLVLGYHLNLSYGQKFFGDKALISSVGASLAGQFDTVAGEAAMPQLGLFVKPALTYTQHAKVSLDSLGYKNKVFDFGSVLSYLKLGAMVGYEQQEVQLDPDIRFVFEHEFDPLGLVPLFGGSLQFHGSSTHLWSMYAHHTAAHVEAGADAAEDSHIGHHHFDLPGQHGMRTDMASGQVAAREMAPASAFVHKASLAVSKVTAGQLISLSFNHTMAQNHIELLPSDPTEDPHDEDGQAEAVDQDEHPVAADLNKPQLFDTSRSGFSVKQHIDLYYEYIEYGILATLSFYRHPDPEQLSQTEAYGWLFSLGYEL